MIVYLIKNRLNGKGYVGQTIHSVDKRFNEHVRAARRGSKYPIHCAIRKYGPDNFEVTILKECLSQDEMNTEEIRSIEELRTTHDGYNLALGGSGVHGRGLWRHTEAARTRISRGNSGKVRTVDVRKKISDSVRAVMTEAHKELIRSRTSKALTAPGMHERLSKAHSRSVSQFEPDGTFIARYESAVAASRSTGINHGNLCTCARTEKGTAGGFVWRYLDEGVQ